MLDWTFKKTAEFGSQLSKGFFLFMVMQCWTCHSILHSVNWLKCSPGRAKFDIPSNPNSNYSFEGFSRTAEALSLNQPLRSGVCKHVQCQMKEKCPTLRLSPAPSSVRGLIWHCAFNRHIKQMACCWRCGRGLLIYCEERDVAMMIYVARAGRFSTGHWHC